jgi:2-polyprenyl-6-methoxyphenol hydroxylase-like FAD-dependent oxidoreductase
VIVGAGPTGLAAAITLADAGVDFVVLDRLAEGANTSRAGVVHARTMEVLDGLGIAGELRSRGIVVPRFSMFDGPKTLATMSFTDLPTAFPFMVMVPQDVTEAVLLRRLRKAGGDVHRPYQVTGLTSDDTGVTVAVTDTDGQAHAIRAGYVIGADGMHSVVREQAGIGFDGGSYPGSFVLADVHMRWPVPRDQAALYLAPDGFLLVAALPESDGADRGDRYRVVAIMADAPEKATVADIQALLDSRGPRPGAAKVEDVMWASRFRVHHRLADRYRAGRVLVAGDAAHVHSPAGGQGMNTGIQDAVALGELLTRVVAGGEPDSLLDTYETSRRPVAAEVVAFTDRITKMTTLPGSARLLRNVGIQLGSRIPMVRRQMTMRMAELAHR